MFLPGRYKFFAVSDENQDSIQCRVHLSGRHGAPYVLNGPYFLGYIYIGGGYEHITVTFRAKGTISQFIMVNEDNGDFYKFPISHGNKRYYKIIEADVTIKAQEKL